MGAVDGHRVLVPRDEEFWGRMVVMVEPVSVLNATELCT